MSATSSSSPENASQDIDLVIQGGGVKVIGLLGALAVLEERGFRTQHLAGTSAGSLVAALSAAGYRADEIRQLIDGDEFRSFLDLPWYARLPVTGPAFAIWWNLGLARGEQIEQVMRTLLDQRGIRSFRDLVHEDYADHPRYRYRLQIIAADVTDGRLLTLPHDASRFGIDPDDLEIARAVRMSSAIPFVYRPVTLQDPESGRAHHIVDGGLLSNLPLWIFDQPGVPAWPTFGLRITHSPDDDASENLLRVLFGHTRSMQLARYAVNLLRTVLIAHDRWHRETADYARTIDVPAGPIDTLDFKLSPQEIIDLYQSGVDAAEAFLARWDVEEYLETYRQEQLSRRRHPDVPD